MNIDLVKYKKKIESEFQLKQKNSLNKFHLLLVNLNNNIIEPELNIFINNSVNSYGLMNYIHNSYKYFNKIIQIYIFKDFELIKFLFPIKFENINDIDTINDYLLYCFKRNNNSGYIEDLNGYINNMGIDNKYIIYF